MNPFTAIGKPTPLIDAPQKASGTAEFVSDVHVPGLLAGKVLRSPHPHARILHVDVEAARNAPGVHAVVTGTDAPNPRWGWTALKDQFVLATDRVRFAGEEGAAGAARHSWALSRMERGPDRSRARASPRRPDA